MAMPTAASMPIFSRATISRRVLIPPAAMMGCDVAARRHLNLSLIHI